MAGLIKKSTPTETVGTIKQFAGTSAPSGWAMCDGTAVSRSTFAALFAVIGTTYGEGDGSTTFNLPDFRGAAPAGAGTSVGYTQNETITLGAKHNDQMQGHTHNSSGYNIWIAGGAPNIASGADTGRQLWEFGSMPTSDGTNGTPRVGKVTRGKVVGVNFIIKVS